MNPLARLAAYAGLLGCVAAAAAGAGFAFGPLGDNDGAGGHASETMAGDHGADGGDSDALSGLSVARDGYRLVLGDATLSVGRTVSRSFRILDANGHAVRDFDLEGGVRMHLIVVRRDLTGYQHLHPTLAADGTLTTELALSTGGVWRAFADFERDGSKTVLAADLFATGDFVPEALPAPRSRVAVAGYQVELTGAPRAGLEGELAFHISRGGQPVEPEPYLGARGHLVALREGDLGYLHVHPLEDAEPGEVAFAATFPTVGRYRLFLQFDDDGGIHTAAFTLQVRR